jgi:hypothetical protein
VEANIPKLVTSINAVDHIQFSSVPVSQFASWRFCVVEEKESSSGGKRLKYLISEASSAGERGRNAGRAFLAE